MIVRSKVRRSPVTVAVAVTTDGEAVTCQLCVNVLKGMAAAHKAAKTPTAEAMHRNQYAP